MSQRRGFSLLNRVVTDAISRCGLFDYRRNYVHRCTLRARCFASATPSTAPYSQASPGYVLWRREKGVRERLRQINHSTRRGFGAAVVLSDANEESVLYFPRVKYLVLPPIFFFFFFVCVFPFCKRALGIRNQEEFKPEPIVESKTDKERIFFGNRNWKDPILDLAINQKPKLEKK